MSGVAGGYTLVLADEAHDGAPVNDYIVTDGGVLFATRDHGASWRCFGLVDPEMSCSSSASWRPSSSPRRTRCRRRPAIGSSPSDARCRRRQIPAPSSNRSSSLSIFCVSSTAFSRWPLRSGWISSSSFSISTMRATRHLIASATGSGRCR